MNADCQNRPWQVQLRSASGGWTGSTDDCNATQSSFILPITIKSARSPRRSSPLRYQKRIRLLDARSRRMAGEGNATSVALGLVYPSLNQFSRDYARQFGLPPSEDMALLRGHRFEWPMPRVSLQLLSWRDDGRP
ncbi:AraC family transcriptional regulator [Rhizobium brockwellii]|nr:AraC family transcriptional regulator [Rhizobium brockwellii]MDV4158525.1 AraC family transcriptional regulator [Rhizobium brockwellii]